MRLLGSLTSPFVRKVRIVAREKGIAYEFVVSDPWDAQSEIHDLNPLGKVPVLELDDGSALFDSAVIVEYFDALQGESLVPIAAEARLLVQRWHALADGVLDAVVARLLETRRPADKRSDEMIARQETKVARALAFADKTHRGENYLVDERLTVADLAFGVALEYIDFRYPHDWRARHPRLALWLAGLSTRPSFAETRPPGME